MFFFFLVNLRDGFPRSRVQVPLPHTVPTFACVEHDAGVTLLIVWGETYCWASGAGMRAWCAAAGGD